MGKKKTAARNEIVQEYPVNIFTKQDIFSYQSQ